MNPRTHCPSANQRRFESFTEAANYLASAQVIVGAPVGIEKCHHCQGWHLTPLQSHFATEAPKLVTR